MSRWEGIIIGVSVVLMLLWVLTPVYWIIRTSLMSPRAAMTAPPEWLPHFPTLSNYFRIFSTPVGDGQSVLVEPSQFSRILVNGLVNSMIVAGFVAIFTTLLATPMAYAFSRYSFHHKHKILFTLILTRAIPPVTMAVPYYHLYLQWSLLGTTIGLIAVYLALTIPITAWVLMGFFSALPTDVEAAAKLDGLGRFSTFRRIFIPMARPSITIAAILAFLMAWNEYSLALILTSGTPAMTLPVALWSLGFGEMTLQSAGITLSLLPPLFVALVLQRHLTQVRIIDPIAG